MKDKLTKEESANLISLGVPKEKATGNCHIVIQNNNPIFTLADLLEILPKEIDAVIQGMELITINKCEVGYAYNDPYDGLIWEKHIIVDELIDALYELCVWCLENKYLKF